MIYCDGGANLGIISALEKIVGSDRVSTSEAVCLSYSFNCFYGKDILRKPDIVVMAETPEEVSGILKAANEYKVPITPKGAAGGAGTGGPLRGGILLDLTLMDRVILIDSTNMKAVAEAGCSFFKLSQELFKNGLMLPIAVYGPGPNVAASAITPPNGLGETRYGVNINLVEGLEVVLPSSEIIRVGSMAYADKDFGPYYRYITGPDLVGLFTKSNGAFGIVTKVAYRCLRRPKLWAFHSYYWPEEKVEDMTKTMMESAAVEVFDCHLMSKWWMMEMVTTLPDDCYFALEFMIDAENEQELNGKEQTIKDICKKHGGTYLPDFAEYVHTKWPTFFWAPGFVTLIFSSTPNKRPHRHQYLLDEPIYPVSKVPEVFAKIVELAKKHRLPAQVGFDGFIMNCQVICSPLVIELDDSDSDVVERFHKCQAEFREWFGEKGGTFQYRLPPAVPDFVWTNQLGAFNLLRSIKSVLDPNNIMSPGTFELGET